MITNQLLYQLSYEGAKSFLVENIKLSKSNKDRKITNGELRDYLVQNVSQKALELGRPQEPSLAGNANKVLIKY